MFCTLLFLIAFVILLLTDSDRRREEDRRRDEDRGRDRRDEDRRRADRRSERSEELIQRKSRPMSPPPVPLRQHHERPRQTSPVRHTRPLSPPSRDRDYRDRDYRDQDYRRDSRDGGDYSSRDGSSRRSRREQEERPPTRHHVKEESGGGGGGGGDTFWDSKWEAKELQKEADAKERRGKHFLDNSNRHHKDDIAGSKRDKKHKSRTPSPESEELRRLKEMRAVTSLEVKESEKYVAEPEDPSQFEWNPTTKMWGRKQVVEEGDLEIKEGQGPSETAEEGEEKYHGDGSFDSDLQKRMQEQVKEGKRKFIPIDSAESRSLTMDEIEEIRKKREKFKKEKGEGKNDKPANTTSSATAAAARPVKKEDKEEGEVGSDEEHEPKYKKRKTRELSPPPKPTRRRSRSRSRRRSRSRDTRKRSPLEPLSRGSRGGYDDYRSSKREYYHDYR